MPMTPLNPVPTPEQPSSELHRTDSVNFMLPTNLEAPGSTSNHDPTVHRTQAEIEKEIHNEIRVRILDTKEAEPRTLPKWIKFYWGFSYFMYFCIFCFSIYYLVQVGIFQADERTDIQYSEIVKYLGLNSYSILCPLLCPVFMIVLAYHVRRSVNLDEGDFFGLLGFMLFCSLVSFHDAYGMWKLKNTSKDMVPKTKVWDPPPKDEASRDDLHWQYAWSTSRTCAKEYVRDLIYQHDFDRTHIYREIVVEFKEEAEAQGRQLSVGSTEPPPPEDVQCDGFHASKDKAKLRKWIVNLQNRERCCGPYGFLEWKEHFTDKPEEELTKEDWKRMGCKDGWRSKKDPSDIKGCYEPLMRWLHGICNITFWIMIVQGILYFVSAIMAVIHHTAMKMEEERIVKQYSLLDMTNTPKEDPWWRESRPPDKPVISGVYDQHEVEMVEGARAKSAHTLKRMRGIISRKMNAVNAMAAGSQRGFASRSGSARISISSSSSRKSQGAISPRPPRTSLSKGRASLPLVQIKELKKAKS